MKSSTLRHSRPVSALFDPKIVVPAIGFAFQARSPDADENSGDVRARSRHRPDDGRPDPRSGDRRTNIAFEFQIILWLSFTVLFADFATAVAEGRGKARRRRSATSAATQASS